MKNRWKSANRNIWRDIIFVLGIAPVLMISDCQHADKNGQTATLPKGLEGLVKPTNQIIISEVNTVTPKYLTITPVFTETGSIAYDPRLINNVSIRYTGRIEKLYVRYNFQTVLQGQRLMDIYSPDILTEQQNLIFLLESPVKDDLILAASKKKLLLLGLLPDQIDQIISTKQPINPLPVFSPYTGHIHDIGISGGSEPTTSSMGNAMPSSSMNTPSPGLSPILIENLPSSRTSELSIQEGMYVQRGQSVFAVYSTKAVWAVLNIFPKDARFIQVDNKVVITNETHLGQSIAAVINYIEPVVGQNASAIQARIYLQNTDDLNLKIGTLLTAKITASKIPGWWVPRAAVIDLGQKQIVFERREDHFQAKQVRTGFTTDSLIQILGNLDNSTRIAVNAQYLIDSESFIQIKDNE